ncbi:MAG: cell division protein FtsL [Gammaproteobacteria bacterium]|jgi:cell division protein FtsL
MIKKLFISDFVKIFILFLLVVVSITFLSHMRYEKRTLFAEQQNIIRERDRLEVEKNRLLIERDVQMLLPRIEEIAKNQIGLVEIDSEDLVLVVLNESQ